VSNLDVTVAVVSVGSDDVYEDFTPRLAIGRSRPDDVRARDFEVIQKSNNVEGHLAPVLYPVTRLIALAVAACIESNHSIISCEIILSGHIGDVTGAATEVVSSLGSTVAFDALRADEIDV
jgi:hypothetical protein